MYAAKMASIAQNPEISFHCVVAFVCGCRVDLETCVAVHCEVALLIALERAL